MALKPTTALGYQAVQTSYVRATCLYVATKLGSLADDLVVVGGLVPTLLVDQEHLPYGAVGHVGTTDLDVGLSVLLLEQERYKAVGEQLRRAGFQPDRNEKGNPARQRWVIQHEGVSVTMDFLIAPTLEEDRGGGVRDLEVDFAAFIMPGVQLAFEDRVSVPLEGLTLFGERAKRSVQVCGPGAFVVLKALALRLRGENKDAYDLFYLIRNYGPGVEAIARRLAPLMKDEKAQEALAFLREDFEAPDCIGPSRAARFIKSDLDDEIQEEAVDFIQQLILAVDQMTELKDD